MKLIFRYNQEYKNMYGNLKKFNYLNSRYLFLTKGKKERSYLWKIKKKKG